MTNQMKNKNQYDVTITRVFDAPREIVFQAWTDAKLVQQWWGPKYFTNPLCEVDARPGGQMLIHMQAPDGQIYPDRAIFHEVVAPERLVFTSMAFEHDNTADLEVLFTVTFADENGKTRMTLHGEVINATPEMQGPLSGMEEGWSMSFDKLEEALIYG